MNKRSARKSSTVSQEEHLDGRKEDVILDAMVRDSKGPLCRSRVSGGINWELLGRFFDADQLAYEESLCQPAGRRFVPIGDFSADAEESYGEHGECGCDGECCCEDGKVVLRDCTQYDLMSIPEVFKRLLQIVHRRITVIRGKLVEIFDLVFSFESAEELGLLQSA